ncbi:MAG TPA: hypothetical protein VHE78_13305 [Gemmatimonadaceae bacterium]|nr:hypothetical protein [Gemmatimonadaceae bacterium]
MRQLSPTRRLLIAVFAIAQMAVPALVSVADARLVSGSAGATQVHVEDHTGRACRALHQDDCALCQLLSHLSSARAPATTLPGGAIVRQGVRCGAAPLLSFVARARERSRAPPVG